MGSSQADSSAYAARTQGRVAREYYNLALPGLSKQYDLLNKALAEGGEPGYLARAFEGQRTGLAEGALGQEMGATRGALAASQGAAQGGNLGATVSPSDIGKQLANAMWGSRVQEGLGRVDQMNNLIAMALGQTGRTGSAATNAAGQQLQAISMMPNYNPTYATILGLGNVAGAGYGGYQDYMANQTAIYNRGGV
jgi:hypothetical protein